MFIFACRPQGQLDIKMFLAIILWYSLFAVKYDFFCCGAIYAIEKGAALHMKHKNTLKSDIYGLEASVQMCLMGFSFLIVCINVLMYMYACALTFRTVALAVFLSPADGVQISTVQQSTFPIIAACTAGGDQLKQVLLRHKASRESPPTCIHTHIL